MKELKQYLKDNGIVGISWAIFTDYVDHNGLEYKANCTVEYFCEKQALLHNMTSEQYAKDTLELLKAPRKRVIADCPICKGFIFEGEVHACN